MSKSKVIKNYSSNVFPYKIFYEGKNLGIETESASKSIINPHYYLNKKKNIIQ